MRVSRETERGLWLERGARALALGYDEAGGRECVVWYTGYLQNCPDLYSR